jgi:hypothetical protein
MPTKTTTTLTMPGRSERRSGGLSHRKEDDVRTFTFDRCYWSVSRSDPNFASQELVFAEVCASSPPPLPPMCARPCTSTK